ncbi:MULTISPECIES: nucleotidyltransferase family protein [unclassified Alteromonas]|uniref:nucleotidyltransferase family protein n=1 Tax=unclassified Alteromonas TaxID=2614992 RepID=UPI0005099B93|nr:MULTISPECIES: nucleotidyltransferase family protein [unclassified Alteromonas]
MQDPLRNVERLKLDQRVCEIIQADSQRMSCLHALQQLALPQGYLGAGFLRNAIWDFLHQKSTPTPLKDVDVIYFDANDTQRAKDTFYEMQLNEVLPQVKWQVKNQARMHVLHGHAPYKNCEEAISYWIEKETCLAIALSTVDSVALSASASAKARLSSSFETAGPFDILAPYGLQANFAGTISINPKYPRPDVFNERVQKKRWCEIWPTLTVKP